MRIRLVVDGETHDIEVEATSKGLRVRVDGSEYGARTRVSETGVAVRIGPRTHYVRFEGTAVFDGDASHRISVTEVSEEGTALRELGGPETGAVEVRPSMPGRVVRVSVVPGAPVRRGQTLVVLEAMKMQNEIPAPGDGVVREIRVAEGETITADRVVAVVDLR